MKKTSIRFLTVLIAVAVALTSFPIIGYSDIFALCASAKNSISEGQCGENAFWTLENGVLTVSGSGALDAESPFSGNDDIKSVVIKRGITEIGANAFESCANLADITIPNTVKIIGDEAFYDCPALTDITLSSELEAIGNSAFEGTGLTEITIPKNVTEIGCRAFSDCVYLSEATIFGNPEAIKEKTFSDCSALVKISFSGSVTEIEKAAFYGCDIIADVYFAGTQAQWDAVSIGTRNNPLSTAEIHFIEEITHEHAYKSSVHTPAACSEDGIMEFTCKCGDTYTEPIPAAHSWSDWTYYSQELDKRTCELCEEDEFKIKNIGTEILLSLNVIEETNDYIIIGVALDSGTCSGIDLQLVPDAEKISGCEYITETDYYYSFGRGTKQTGGNNTSTGNPETCKFSFATTIPFTPSEECFVSAKFIKKTRQQSVKEDFSLIVTDMFDAEESSVVPRIINNLPEAQEHVHQFTSQITKESSCCEEGILTYTCGECGYSYTESIAPAHKIVHKTIPATCTKTGLEYDVCSVCSEVISYSVTNTIEHNWSDWQVTKNVTCTENGSKCRHCLDCDDTQVIEIEATGHSLSHWKTTVEPTTTTPGLKVQTCTKCGQVINTKEIPCLEPIHVTGISISSDSEILNPGDTLTLTAVISPDNADNKNTVWTSSDTAVVSVENGVITALKPGIAEITVKSEDGDFTAVCKVNVIGIASENGAVIDYDNGFIYGLAVNLDSTDGYVVPLSENVSISMSTPIIGTGTIISVIADGKTIGEYEAVIFGDVNGDGWYDGQDAMKVNLMANGLLTKELVGEATWMAADCNHDGTVDSLDVEILNQAGLLLSGIDQSASSEELMETSTAYAEYVNLIEQSVESADNRQTEYEPSPLPEYNLNFFEKIIVFFMAIRKYIFSFLSL